MFTGLAVVLAMTLSPPRTVDAAFLKGVEACHGGIYESLDEASFLRGAGFIPVTQTEFEYDWRWRGDGYEIQAWSNMFGCGSRVLQGRMSDQEAVRVIRPWAEQHGYRRPTDASAEPSMLLYLMIKREDGFDIALGRDDAGRIHVSMAPGYFVGR